jgi:CelD/BcsL family acetyltransferase involved in cellulose biosynthesis
MKVRLFPFRRLAREHLAAWSEIQLSHDAYDSPYFRPEYHQLAAEVGRPVMVGVMEQGDCPVGFFPFEKSGFGIGLPVGLRLSDFHGAIVAPTVDWDARPLLAACGLRRYVFDHLANGQEAFCTGPVTLEPSPVIEVGGGFAAYRAVLQSRGEKEFDRVVKKREKAERQGGIFEFRFHDPRPVVIDTCFAWKKSQYQRTGALNVLQSPWVDEFLRRIARSDSPYFAGRVATLHHNNELVAVHVGMRSSTVLHHWFPAHNPEHSSCRFSPGLQLLVGMIEGAAAAGLRRIDLGKGDYSYKRQFCTGASHVAEGVCGGTALERSVARSMKDAKHWLRKKAEASGVTSPIHWYRNMRDWLVMR